MNTNPSVSTIIRPHTSESALPDVLNGLTWYHMVYSHNQGWPGKLPVSFIIPH